MNELKSLPTLQLANKCASLSPIGFTLDIDGKEPLSGFVVSPFKEKEYIIKGNVINVDIRTYILDNIEYLLSGFSIGGWRNEKYELTNHNNGNTDKVDNEKELIKLTLSVIKHYGFVDFEIKNKADCVDFFDNHCSVISLKDKSCFVLDMVGVYDDKQTAINIGKDNDQDAIYDFNKGEVIDI